MVATRSSSRSANASQQKKTALLEENDGVEAKRSRRSTLIRPPLSSQKIRKQNITRRKPRLSMRNGGTESVENNNSPGGQCLSKYLTYDEPVPSKKPRRSQKKQDQRKEGKQSLGNEDERGERTQDCNELVVILDIKAKNEEGSDQWEDFGNTSEEVS